MPCPADTAGSGSTLYRHYVLAVLLLAYILSFIDRNVMAVLVEPIRADLGISDFQFSLLHGLAFATFYTVLGLPIGRLADRFSRRWIITAGVTFWSAMTCLCGAARSFPTLFLARMGVGVGEAALSPPSHSLLADYYPARQLPRALAVYTLGITIGGSLAYKLGGEVYAWFQAHGAVTLPVLGTLRPWQMTFVLVGLPGFLVALLLLTVREPKRRGVLALADNADWPDLRQTLQYLRRHWPCYGSVFASISLLSILGYGVLSWVISFLIRTYDVPRAEAAGLFFWILLLAGSAGTLAGGWYAAWLARRHAEDASMRVVVHVAVLMAGPAVATPLMPTATLACVGLVPVAFCLNAYFGVAIAGLQLVTPNQLRAQVSAVLLFMTNFFGLAVGPVLVAGITDYGFGHDAALRYSLAIVGGVMAPLAALTMGWGLRHYRAAYRALHDGTA